MHSKLLNQIIKISLIFGFTLINSSILFSQGDDFYTTSHQLVNPSYHYASIFFLIGVLCSLIYFHFLNRKKSTINEYKIHNIEVMLAKIVDEKRLLLSKLQEKEVEIDKILQKLQNEEVKANVNELKEIILLTEDDWEEFLSVFQKSYPGYVDQLQEEYENLSLADIRYILLTFLGYTHKEMAKILAISTDSLRVSWYRLRKKLQLTEEITREIFIQGVNEKLGHG